VKYIIADNFASKKMPSFCRKNYKFAIAVQGIIKFLYAKFQQCLLLNYFVTVDLVASPKITGLLRRFIISARHSVYVIVDCKVITM